MSGRRFCRTRGGVCSIGAAPGVVPEVSAPCGELLGQVAGEHGWRMVVKVVMPDHVHVFVRAGPTHAPAQVVRAFTGRTARVGRSGFRYLRRLEKMLWWPWYVAASIGHVWESTVRRDIEHHWDAVAS